MKLAGTVKQVTQTRATLKTFFFELFEKISKEEIKERAKEYLTTRSNLSETKLTESVDYMVNNIYTAYHLVKDSKNLTNETIDKEIKDISEEIIKRANQDDKNPIQYDDSFLLGSLINILEDSQKTRRLLSNLSYELTNMPFSQFHEGYELVDVLQSLRPKLIELYNRTDYDD